MTLTLYGLTKCTTCQKAEAWLKERKIAYNFVDVRETPLEAAQVTAWFAKLGGWDKTLNRAGYTWRGLPASDTSSLNDKKAVALALAHPALIRRPLIEHGDGGITAGFSSKVQELIVQ